MNKKLLQGLGFQNQFVRPRDIIRNAESTRAKSLLQIRGGLQDYDNTAVTYRTNNRTTLSQSELLPFINSPANDGVKVFTNTVKQFDLALEGGSAYGFAHLGVAQAFAFKGIGLNRISGTSAGSIAGALLAAGYEIDLNYKVKTETFIQQRLAPSATNSANQLLFEDYFVPLTDMPTSEAEVRSQIPPAGLLK